MKLTKLITNIFALSLMFFIASCAKDEKLPSEPIQYLGGYKPEGNPEIDSWIVKNLTTPYNVLVKYQYDPFEIDYTKNTVPPKEEYVIPVMKMVLTAMATPYITVHDSILVEKIIPKTWVLVGSGQYNNDGTVVLGTAEGANKITVMDINKFSKTEQFVRNILYTVHHETAHVLNQRKIYSPAFKYVNPSDYTSAWFNVNDSDAKKKGFVRNYGMASPDEDFVETVAFLLVYGQAKYDALIAAASDTGKTRFKLKQQYVMEYFTEKWDIDFKKLQIEVEKGIQASIKGL